MNGRILLIDDNQMDLKVASAFLERQGYACFGFTKHQEALAWIESQTPQIIFLDLQMPDVNGYQLIPILKKHPMSQNSPIIIMSGKNQVQDVTKAIELGANDYLIKPIDTLVLHDKVNRMHLRSGEEFASVPVPAGLVTSARLMTKLSFLYLSEFGAQVRSESELQPGEVVEIGGLPPDKFGADRLLARCLSSDPAAEPGRFLAQLTFVGLTEVQRQSLRKLCRQIWVQSKSEGA